MQNFIRQDLWLVPTVANEIDAGQLEPIGLSLFLHDDLRERFYEEATVVMTGFTSCRFIPSERVDPFPDHDEVPSTAQWNHKKNDTIEFDARMRPPEVWLKARFEKSIDLWRIGVTVSATAKPSIAQRPEA